MPSDQAQAVLQPAMRPLLASLMKGEAASGPTLGSLLALAQASLGAAACEDRSHDRGTS